VIIRQIALDSDLDDDQRGRLTAAVERCPVQRFLNRPVSITTVPAETTTAIRESPGDE
jgi:uncharacterized OsmC-like protein